MFQQAKNSGELFRYWAIMDLNTKFSFFFFFFFFFFFYRDLSYNRIQYVPNGIFSVNLVILYVHLEKNTLSAESHLYRQCIHENKFLLINRKGVT